MDKHEVLALFDLQMRRWARPEGPMARTERDGAIVRHIGAEQDWNAVVWSDLDQTTAEAAIARQVRHFGSQGLEFEWKLYGYDQPEDLGTRLRAAGFHAEESETLMVAPISDLDLAVALPNGVHVRAVTDPAGVDLLVHAAELAFDSGGGSLRNRLLAQLGQGGQNLRMFVVMAGDQPICSARLDLNQGTAFAGLWGGGTVPEWRRRGVYRALVAHRARIAADLGYEYLQVDASEMSRPILHRLGFAALTTITAYRMPAPE